MAEETLFAGPENAGLGDLLQNDSRSVTHQKLAGLA
jgi:hypothetical protein